MFKTLTGRSSFALGALAFGLSALGSTPASAGTAGAASSFDYYAQHSQSQRGDKLLSRSEEKRAREFFTALDAENWEKAQQLVEDARGDLLSPIMRAELYLAANSPRVEREPLVQLLRDAPYIPQAAQLGRLAQRRGATDLNIRDAQRRLTYHSGPPVRGKPRSVEGGNSLHSHHAGTILDAIKDSNPDRAMRYFEAVDDDIDVASRTEWLQRISWSYYIENQPHRAFAVSEQAIRGSGPWLADSYWVRGLAAWKLNDYAQAETAFHRAASFADNQELKSAGYYWSSRAAMRSGQPQKVEPALRAAAQQKDALYSLLARESLGLSLGNPAGNTGLTSDDRKALERSANAKMAMALTDLGRANLADEILRHEARRANGLEHDLLVKLADHLALPRLQAWLGHYAPSHVIPSDQAHFPSPGWQPVNGWKVDPALVYAHVKQESAFRADAVSSANARGLMQVRPGTASDMARIYSINVNTADLHKPEVNLALGQAYLETLSKRHETQGLLPKVIAAYNAGMAPVGRWNTQVQAGDDPLLYIESIPYYETRAYVGIVLRNYWKYEAQAGISSRSAYGLAQGLWPRFPNRRGVELVRLNGARKHGG